MTDHNIPAAEDVSEDDFETVGDYHRIAAHHFDAKEGLHKSAKAELMR